MVSMSSGFRINPDDEFINRIIDIFIKKPDMEHIQEIYINKLNHHNIITSIEGLYPELQIYYFPSKLNAVFTKKDEKDEISIDIQSCIRILRQVLRNAGYTVNTKSIVRKGYKDTVVIIYPKHINII